MDLRLSIVDIPPATIEKSRLLTSLMHPSGTTHMSQPPMHAQMAYILLYV